jgi:putative flippase GtrA
MAPSSSRIGTALWRKARSNVGVRFTRFTVVAVASLIASQVSLSLLLGPAHLTAGLAGGLAAVIGAGVSYVLSRWAWERKGRPNLLKETLPFWLVSVMVWVLLALSAKLGVHLAASMNLTGAKRIAVADGVYFAANCLTFVLRFVIFHYILFADARAQREPASGVAGPGVPSISSSSEAAEAAEVAVGDPFAMASGPTGPADSAVPADRGDADPGPDAR